MTDVPVMNPRAEAAAFDLSAYLGRIGLDAPPLASVEGLARLVRAHRLAIPFENLDIMLGRGVSLDPAALFDKLIHRRRGGYCFEQNALLDRAVAALGMDGRPLLARVWLGVPGEEEVPPLTHQLELVNIEGEPWIVDAGFGGSLSPPIRLAEGETEAGADGARFRLSRHERFGWMLERRGPAMSISPPGAAEAEWQRQYSFTTGVTHPFDRELGNHWTSTRSGTPFTSAMLVSRITENGFVSLMGNRLKTRELSNMSEAPVESADALRQMLDRHFGIAVNEEEAERLFQF